MFVIYVDIPWISPKTLKQMVLNIWYALWKAPLSPEHISFYYANQITSKAIQDFYEKRDKQVSVIVWHSHEKICHEAEEELRKIFIEKEETTNGLLRHIIVVTDIFKPKMAETFYTKWVMVDTKENLIAIAGRVENPLIGFKMDILIWRGGLIID